MENAMEKLYLVLNWTFGLIFLLFGLITIHESIFASLAIIVAASFLLPPIRKFFVQKSKVSLPPSVKAIAISTLLIVYFRHIPSDIESSIFTSIILIFIGYVACFFRFKYLNDSDQKPSEDLQNFIKNSIHITTSYQNKADSVSTDKKIDKDAWEGSFWEIEKPLPVKANLHFKYTDGNGHFSDRSVNVRQFGLMGSYILLIGHCHMRNATRTFRSDRIESCFDEDTGEVIENLHDYLFQKYENSPDRTKDILLDSQYDTLRVLLYVGKADGQFRAAEKEVIKVTCISISKDSRLTVALIDDLYKNMDSPTLHAFKLAVGRLAKRSPEEKYLVLSSAEKIVATQKTIHPAEQEALNYMQDKFKISLSNDA